MTTTAATPEIVHMGHNPSPAAVALLDSIWLKGRLRKSEPRNHPAPARILWQQLSGNHPFFSSAALDLKESDLPIIEQAYALGCVRAMEAAAPDAAAELEKARARLKAADPGSWEEHDALWCIEQAESTLKMAAAWNVHP